MKKTLFAVLALAAVAACNKSEVVEQNPANAIGFSNVFVDNATKSVSDPSYTAGNMFADFAVYGFVEGATLFDGTTVTGPDWTYEGVQYWIPGAFYNFCAVAPKENGGWTKSECAVSGEAINTALVFTSNGTTDLLYAEHERVQGQLTGNSKVDFTFRHILSKVKFSFANGYNASGATIAVRDIKVTNAYTKANVALTASATEWSAYEGTQTLTFGAATDNETTADVFENEDADFAYGATYESVNERFLIPTATEKEYVVECVIDLYVNGSLVKTYERSVANDSALKVSFAPAPGCSYDIKATITYENIDPNNPLEPIEFTVNELPGWTATAAPELN